MPAGLIAFTYDGTGVAQVYTMAPDGSGLTQITTGGTNWAWVRWSKDGSRFLVSDTGGNVWTYAADGTDPQQITNLNTTHLASIYEGQGDWSPDGTKVALFYGFTAGKFTGVQIVNVDNSGFTTVPLSDVQTSATPIIWTRDGTKFAYGTNGVGEGDTTVCNIDGSGVTTILAGDSDWGYTPWAWYPDSTNVLIGAQNFTTFEQQILKSDGSTITTLFTDVSGSTLGGYCMDLDGTVADSVAWADVEDSPGIAVMSEGTILFHNAVGAVGEVGMSWIDAEPPPLPTPPGISAANPTTGIVRLG